MRLATQIPRFRMPKSILTSCSDGWERRVSGREASKRESSSRFDPLAGTPVRRPTCFSCATFNVERYERRCLDIKMAR